MLKSSTNAIKYLSSFLLLLIVVQILLGAWVRLTGSGMSCPDWPLCYGYFFPTYDKINQLGNIQYTYFQVFLEWIHRANAAFLIGPVAIILFLYLNLAAGVGKKLKVYSYYFIALLGMQALLGGLTVKLSNIPWSVAIHLASAFLLFYFVLNILLLSSRKIADQVYIKNYLRKSIYFCLFMALITACAGAFTSKYGASMACSRWPLCNEGFFPNINDQFELIHFMHRLLVFLLVSTLSFLLFKLRKNYVAFPKISKVVFFIIPGIIVLQIIIGALLILFNIPTWMGIFHQFMGLSLFASISIFLFYTNEKK